MVNGQADDVIGWRGDDVSRSVDADTARADVAEVMTSADQVLARGRAWRRVNGAWTETAARVACDQRRSSFERRVGARAVVVMAEALVKERKSH